MPNEVMEGNERGTYSRARTYYVTGTRDGLRGKSLTRTVLFYMFRYHIRTSCCSSPSPFVAGIPSSPQPTQRVRDQAVTTRIGVGH